MQGDRMTRFVEGRDRNQATLFPARLDEALGDDHPVRVVDAYIDALELEKLGFNVEPEPTGRPGYHPGTMLKIYLYGYLNQIQSSRRLERECGRNVELMWLTGQLAPDFKTIADFRKDNGPAIRDACRRFVALCRNMHLLDEAKVAIDGSKFKAVNNREKNFTHDRLKKRMQSLEDAVGRYLADLDRADRQADVSGVPIPAAKISAIKDRIEGHNAKLGTLAALEAKLVASGEKQISLTDPDARAMTSQSHSAYTVGYNVQSAVDTKNHLIVTHEVTNVGIDRGQLSSMAKQARDALDVKAVEVLADKGYFKGEEIASCEDAGIAVSVPKPTTSSAKAEGRFDKRDFVYDVAKDHYVCPAGKQLSRRMTREEDGQVLHIYWTNVCEACSLKRDCTTGKERRVRRWDREDVLERVQARLDRNPGAMQVRRETVEHPFGTLKAWMGATHFRMKTLRHVATEMALHVLAYNIKRVLAIVGVAELLKAIAALLLWFAGQKAASRTSQGAFWAHSVQNRRKNACAPCAEF
jgi:transposase